MGRPASSRPNTGGWTPCSEYFDKSQQRALEEMRLQEQQQVNALAMEQNDLLDRQNSIAEKARRDANIAAAVGAVQRHNTNKTIKKWMEK